MRSSYKKEDVVLLLKDITGLVKPQPASERERLIQSGKHYCEMLPIEYVPSEKYMQAYEEALEVFAEPTARAVEVLAEKIVRSRGRSAVLVSLARAGIPAGIFAIITDMGKGVKPPENLIFPMLTKRRDHYLFWKNSASRNQ